MRLWLVILMTLAVAAARPTSAACRSPRYVVVTQSATLVLDGRTVNVATLSIPDLNNELSRLVVRDRQCRVLLNELVDGLESRFELRPLGGTGVLEFVTMQVFGDSTVYMHRLFAFRGGRLQALRAPIENTGKDGFYLGRFVDRKGEGIVTWIADPDNGPLAGPHPFVVRHWPWRDGRFLQPTSYETKAIYEAPDGVPSRADAVARMMKLPYRDQTDPEEFMDYNRVLDRLSALEHEAG